MKYLLILNIKTQNYAIYGEVINQNKKLLAYVNIGIPNLSLRHLA